MTYRAIGFDYDGVITRHERTTFNEEIARLLGVSVEDFRRVYFRHNHLWNIQGVALADGYAIVLRELGKQHLLPQVVDLIASQPVATVRPEMIELVQQIRIRGYRVGMLSNASREAGQQIREGVGSAFDAVLISADIGCQKPSREAFDQLVDALHVSLAELIFIDDTQRSLDSAGELGFTPILFTDVDHLVTTLKQYRVL